MLRWFEEYAKRLKEGMYAVAVQPQTSIELGVPRTPAICLFPMKPPVRLLSHLKSASLPSPLCLTQHATGRQFMPDCRRPAFEHAPPGITTCNVTHSSCPPQTWTWAITRGVHVQVTTVFVPENTRGKGVAADGSTSPPRFCFAYRCPFYAVSRL